MTGAQVVLLGGAIGAALLGYGFGWILRFARDLVTGASSGSFSGD